jgi:DtxR family transcriptional regulator, Mn-dependent transcriptional regulator
MNRMLSQTVEDYLKTIYKLQESGVATTSDIAKSMEVSAASATSMIKRLAKLGLLKHQSYQGVRLTKAGMKIALEIIRHHRLLELYLSEVLGYPIESVHDEAERLEHHISEVFEDKIAELLGNPTHDPHGHPIPTKDGRIIEVDANPLSHAEPGQKLVIHRVSDANSERLRYLDELGLTPKVRLEVLAKAPFNGPLTIRISEEERIIGYEISHHVFVAPLIEAS